MPSIESIPGIQELWSQTLGDRRVAIAILDGTADLSHPCFQGAEISQLPSYWRNPGAANSDDYPIHATHVASVILGQHDSKVKGIAPRCVGINIPIAFDDESVQCPLELTRGIDAARDAGANVIHIASCIQSSSGKADGLLERAVRNCTDNNILVVAPAGNDGGDCFCLPAALPEVLSVGALNDKGTPFEFSNWGGSYQNQGIVAPGENILGAEPGNQTRKRKGTSCAAPVVTGIAGLLMSMQLQRAEEPDAHRIRDAILQSALACQSPDVTEPTRCLAGKLNVPGAMELLFDPRFTRYQHGISRSNRTVFSRI